MTGVLEGKTALITGGGQGVGRCGRAARVRCYRKDLKPSEAGHRRPQGFQNPCDGMRNARLKREDAFSHAMIIVSSAMVSSS